MEQLSLVPNLNLRRLIKDLLAEGGEGLYVYRVDSDEEGDGPGGSSRAQGGGRGRRERGREKEGNREYRFALVTEQILVLKVRVRATNCRCTVPPRHVSPLKTKECVRGYNVLGVFESTLRRVPSAQMVFVCMVTWY